MQQAQVIQIVSAQKKAAIIRRYYELQSSLSAIKSQLDEIKMEAIEALGEGAHTSGGATLTIKWVSRDIFDQATAKTLLTAGQLAQCVKPCEYYDVRVKCNPADSR